MPKKKDIARQNISTDKKEFDALKSYIQKAAVGSLRHHQRFSLCIKASLVKCYEFNNRIRDDKRSNDAFFLVPTLRGICEDLIVLNFIKRMPKADREQLIELLMAHELYSRFESQDKFFSKVRPQQPVLRAKDGDQVLADLKAKIQPIWIRHGWAGLGDKVMPPIRQLAQKQQQPVLTGLYDYLYRLTSGSVHFNVQSLLRSGWGSKHRWVFSTVNFDQYFSAYGRVYGAFLFCVYFEFFGRFLRPGPKVTKRIDEIRKSLIFEPRWPEMVTFEEMNQKLPEMEIRRVLVTAIQAETIKRLMD